MKSKKPKIQLRIVSEPEYSKRKKQNICVVAYCSNKAGNKGKFKFCYKHHRQHQKFNNPLRYWFDVLRQNARSRNKEFNLTIEEFSEFCKKTKYLELKGKNAGSYSIDRVDNSKGYTVDNMQVLTLSQNSRKKWIDLKIQFGCYPTDKQLEEFYSHQEYQKRLREEREAKAHNDKLEENENLDSYEEPPF